MNLLKDTPLVSIIVPVYNVEHYLERCVQSILDQTYKNLEIILINDGSIDRSGILCESLKAKDSRVMVFHQENGGMSVARNKGLAFLKGQFIAFVDSDDWIEREMIADMIYFALSNNLKLVECGVGKSSVKKRKKHKHVVPSFSIIETQEEAMLRVLSENNFSVWRRIYSKEIINNRKFIPDKINEDVFFTIDSINSVEKQGFISNELYIYNTENISVTRSPYSLNKLDAKDALYHIVEHTKHYSKKIRIMANQYLLRGLINHYNPLFTHAYLDPKFTHRKQLKKAFLEQLEKMDQLKFPNGLSFLEYLLLKLPVKIYGFPIRLNECRISIQHKVLKAVRV